MISVTEEDMCWNDGIDELVDAALISPVKEANDGDVDLMPCRP